GPDSESLVACSRGNVGLHNAIDATLPPDPARRVYVGAFAPPPLTSPAPASSSGAFDAKRRLRLLAKCLSHPRHPSIPVFLDDKDRDGHYHMFCKQVLWYLQMTLSASVLPLLTHYTPISRRKPFHYQLPDFPKGQAFEERAWRHYRNVNKLFADAIVANHKHNDSIWINDYHLMLVPQLVRQAIPDATIGFFLHVPFPSSEIFRCLYVRKQILEGILGADLVGFQTYSYLRHFLMTCTRLLSLESTPRGIQLENKAVKVGIFPIGIDMAALAANRNSPDVHAMIESLTRKYNFASGKNNTKIIIGRDKNDYVKGVRQKMLAYELFLQTNPRYHGRVVLIQVAFSTTEENENESQVSQIVSRINATFGSIEYSPVVFLQQNISFSHYLALLSIADACMITSLRDGMNLTSHEYIVCQEKKKSPLIISEFAGTYSSLGAALRVNPWDCEEVAKAICDALDMTDDEKNNRWAEMYSYVSTHTAQNYVNKFVSEIPKVHNELVRLETSHIPLITENIVLKAYKNATRRIFFLDHDGTITNSQNKEIVSDGAIFETEASVVALVRTLASDSQNLVYIMSARRRRDLHQFVGIPNVGLCAENGCFVLYANHRKWHTMLSDQDLSWRKQVIDIFEYYTDRTPGSTIQQNDISIIWHFGQADASFGSWQALECQNHLQNQLGTAYPITILSKQKKIEIFPRNVNKGRICRRILEYHYAGKIGKRLSFPHTGAILPSNNNNNSSPIKLAQLPSQTLASANLAVAAGATTTTLFDFIMCVGDDRADEFMFEYVHLLDSPPSPQAVPDTQYSSEIRGSGCANNFNGGGVRNVANLPDAYQTVGGQKIFSVTVGGKSSCARWYVPGVEDVVGILGKLCA
ncbi:hypothetical protein HK100_006771, partial [Physocladia obscura]